MVRLYFFFFFASFTNYQVTSKCLLAEGKCFDSEITAILLKSNVNINNEILDQMFVFLIVKYLNTCNNVHSNLSKTLNYLKDSDFL